MAVGSGRERTAGCSLAHTLQICCCCQAHVQNSHINQLRQREGKPCPLLHSRAAVVLSSPAQSACSAYD